jgi:hypothetical protein
MIVDQEKLGYIIEAILSGDHRNQGYIEPISNNMDTEQGVKESRLPHTGFVM